MKSYDSDDDYERIDLLTKKFYTYFFQTTTKEIDVFIKQRPIISDTLIQIAAYHYFDVG